MTTFEKIGCFTQEQAEFCVKHTGSIVITGRNLQGVEIHDMRPLMDRVNGPIKGKGIVSWFGSNHLLVTVKKLENLKKQYQVIEYHN